MSYFRVTEQTDAAGRKVLQYFDPEKPQLVFMPRQRGRKGKKKSGQAKIFTMLHSAAQVRRNGLL